MIVNHDCELSEATGIRGKDVIILKGIWLDKNLYASHHQCLFLNVQKEQCITAKSQFGLLLCLTYSACFHLTVNK